MPLEAANERHVAAEAVWAQEKGALACETQFSIESSFISHEDEIVKGMTR